MDEINVQNASEQDTNATMETQMEVNEGTDPETAPQGGEATENTTAQGGESSDTAEDNNTAGEQPFLEIKYNHEKRGLSREEAVTWAQKGIHYEDTYNAIERFATLKGQTVKEFVNGLESAEDEAYRQGLVEKFGDDDETVDKLMELYGINKEKTLTTARKSREQAEEQALQSENARIAEEFTAMKVDFPELTEFKALPDSVKKAALSGMPLEYAYLKHINSEQRKIEAAKQQEADAAKKSTGSLAGDNSDSKTEEERRYLSALWGG